MDVDYDDLDKNVRNDNDEAVDPVDGVIDDPNMLEKIMKTCNALENEIKCLHLKTDKLLKIVRTSVKKNEV